MLRRDLSDQLHIAVEIGVDAEDEGPFAIGCINCVMEILFAGRKTMEGIPAEE